MLSHLFQSMRAESIVLTANQRLAEYLQGQYSSWLQHNDTEDRGVKILSIGHWLQQLFQQSASLQEIDTPTLLGDAQTHAIWEDIIHHSPQGTLLLNTSVTTRLAIDTWLLLMAWQIDVDHHYFELNEDSRVWQQWAKQFQQRCKHHHCIDSSAIINHIIPLIQSGKLTLAKQIILVGFNEISPQQKQLFNALKSRQCLISPQNLSTPSSHCVRLSLTDVQTELRTMARWAKNVLIEDPVANIACIIPQLNELQNDVMRIFTEIFAPQNLLVSAESAAVPFNISVGVSLSTYPIIYAALQIISLQRQQIAITELSTLIRSPYIGGAELEMNARALCDVKLREIGAHKLSLHDVIRVAMTIPGCDLLIQQIQNFIALGDKHFQKHKASNWSILFVEQLNAFNWPGTTPLNNQETVLMEQWQTLLQELNSLDNFIAPCNFHTALNKLNHLANQLIIQEKSPEASIQIMGVLEASGMLFDQLWIMGLDDSAWPAKAQANCFIPLRLQRELNMPHCSAEQEWQFAGNLTTQFLRSAPQVILSYAQQNNDRTLRPSALIKSVQEINCSELSLADDFSLTQYIYQSGECEQFIDELAPAILSSEKIRGGTELIKQQAACPFRAFAIFRLGATRMAEAVTGLPAFERGKLVHTLLEQFWRKTKSHDELLLIDDEQLKLIITKIVSGALLQVQQQYMHLFGPRFFHIEQSRLTDLIYRWLAWEKTRTPFTVIATEQRCNFMLGQLDIHMRADRVDKIGDDQYLIIDYKTSKITVQDWFGDRPDEPQLPLYCIASVVPVNAVAFAQIRTEEINCCAMGETALAENDRSTKVLTAEQWLAQKMQWHTALNHLSAEFASGVAQVNPKHGKQTCDMCHLSSLCRIHEAVV